MFEKILKKLKSKNGNSFLFMPYLVTFGTMMIYIMMEMGTAYVRQIELQVLTDSMARAGIYGGMTGSGAQFYEEGIVSGTGAPHIYVNLDDAVARGLANQIYQINVSKMKTLKKGSDAVYPGQYKIKQVSLCNKSTSGMWNYINRKKVPIWNTKNVTTGEGNYRWTPISNLQTSEEIMSTGNFFVAVDGEYKTLMANSLIGKGTINMRAFASALATAEYTGP